MPAHTARGFPDANQWSDSVTPHVVRNREITQLAICTFAEDNVTTWGRSVM
jgi:hypothetical protein